MASALLGRYIAFRKSSIGPHKTGKNRTGPNRNWLLRNVCLRFPEPCSCCNVNSPGRLAKTLRNIPREPPQKINSDRNQTPIHPVPARAYSLRAALEATRKHTRRSAVSSRGISVRMSPVKIRNNIYICSDGSRGPRASG